MNLEPSSHDADRGTLEGSNLLHWLPKCNSMRTRSGLIESVASFRVMHSAKEGNNNVSVATYREQTVAIALGFKGAS